MPKFRTKSREVNAEQYRKGQPPPQGVKMGNLGTGSPEAYVISDRGGCVEVHDGDFIMEGEAGTFYPCPEALFLERYEPIVTQEVPHLIDEGVVDRMLK